MIQYLLKDQTLPIPQNNSKNGNFILFKRQNVLLCETTGQKSFCGKLGISQDPIPVIRVLVKGDVRCGKQKDLSP